MRTRCDDADAATKINTAAAIDTVTEDLASTMTSAGDHLATRPQARGRAGHGHYAVAIGWLRRTDLRPI